ncbi:MAG: NAD(P)H-dependent glycerol-3-phosphate dehydrogenase [Halocynthiibacter sp.]
MSKIVVLGAGAFGTGLAISFAKMGSNVHLWGRDADHRAAMKAAGKNAKRLPDAPFPPSLQIIDQFDKIAEDDIVLLSVPMQKMAVFLEEYQEILRNKTLVSCAKGVDVATGLGPIETLRAAQLGDRLGILTGPSFAADIAKGLPTALTIACDDQKILDQLQQALSTDNLRLYATLDVIGAELGGALKNVVAIASGIAIGTGFGESARAAIITRGFAEMSRFAVAMGAKGETLVGLSGLGDLTLTATSTQSRNYAYGIKIGAGKGLDTLLTVEGAATSHAVAKIARDKGVDMPICQTVSDILNEKLSVERAVKTLLARPLGKE